MVWSMTADLFLNPEWRSGAVVSTVASSEGLGSVPGSKAFFFFFFYVQFAHSLCLLREHRLPPTERKRAH